MTASSPDERGGHAAADVGGREPVTAAQRWLARLSLLAALAAIAVLVVGGTKSVGVRPDTPEVGARGAALVGATDAGMFASIGDAVACAVRAGHVHQPDPAQAARYAESYARYVDARASRYTAVT